MKENILKDFETFDEFPKKYLCVKNNSDYYYIKNNKNNFIAKANVDSLTLVIINNEEKIISETSFYDIKTGNLILYLKNIENIKEINNKSINIGNGIKVISLSEILNIKGNGEYYLSQDDIDILIDYKEENAKTYNMKPRERYF